jgi:hypothetical protein
VADRPDRHPWLDLLEVDGPFLSRPALDDVYDDAWPPKITNEHRDILAPPAVLPTEWDDTTMEQVDRVLTEVLGYREGRTLKFNPGTVIHPIYDNAAVSPHAAAYSRRDPDKPRLVVLAGPVAAETPDSVDPETITAHYGWPSTAVQRAALAARGLGADLALVTNGWQHLVVWVGSGITGWAWIDPSLYRLDHRLADAFVALLSAASVTTDADTSTADLLRISQEKQVDVTEKLGIQVRQAAEALVNAVSRANRNTDGKLLAGVAPNEVYAGVVTVLMRTVFLLNAEERDLISSGDLWDRSYSVSALLDQLDDDHYRHQGVMRRRHGAWLRLLAAARAVHGGVNHSLMSVPAYGGDLFDPIRHPFLEGVGVDGEVFDVGVVDDATTRHVLELLQRLGGQRLSYRAFSVEQIGQVYESLLDHSAVSVPEDTVVLGLVGTRGAEPEVKLGDLEEQHAKGKLADWLAKNHDPASGKGKTEKWQTRIDRTPDDRVTATLSQACQGNADILARVERFAGLLRADARDVALVFLPGDVYVTETANRRDTGTAYTSPAFAAEIAHHALEHLVYEPGPHNEEDESKWQIKRPEGILELRVCDPAVGSGAILVAAVRYLAGKLVESRLEHGELMARDLETAASDPVETDPHVQAQRDVVSQCIYAVDRDPMAVEMAKLSLWLVTMANGRPFTFLDHAIKCGDSLLGVTSLAQLRRLHLAESSVTQIGLDLDGGRMEGLGGYFSMIAERINQALSLRALVGEGDVKDAADAEERRRLNAKASELLDDLRLAANAMTAACFSNASATSSVTQGILEARVLPLLTDIPSHSAALHALGSERPPDAPDDLRFFHWAIEFPEVLDSGGFDSIVANPPFQGGKKLKAAVGKSYRDHIVRYCADGDSGSADLVAYFFRRASVLAKSFGLIATNTVYQGVTRKVATGALVSGDSQGTIFRADSSAKWPGRDAVYVARVWWDRLGKARWSTPPSVDGVVVEGVASDLYPVRDAEYRPIPIPSNAGIAHIGQLINGDGFLVPPETAMRWIEEDERNARVLQLFVNGEFLNASLEKRERTKRYVVNFHDWPLTHAREFEAPFEHVLAEVKPKRDKVARKVYRENWWKFAERQVTMLKAIQGKSTVIAVAATSPYAMPTLIETSSVLCHALVVFATEDMGMMGLLSSTLHRQWVDRYCSTIKSDVRYTPSSGFATYPLPDSLERIRQEADALYSWREEIMVSQGWGITDVYGKYHDENCDERDVVELRDRHIGLERAVLAAYGWHDVDPKLGFHDARYGRFFTFAPEVRYELLIRLLKLNVDRVAEQSRRSHEVVMREAQQHV